MEKRKTVQGEDGRAPPETTTTATKKQRNSKDNSNDNDSTNSIDNNDSKNNNKNDKNSSSDSDNRPGRPLSAYQLYVREETKKVAEEMAAMKEEDAGGSYAKVLKVVARRWKALPTSEKERYEKESASGRARYHRSLKSRRQSRRTLQSRRRRQGHNGRKADDKAAAESDSSSSRRDNGDGEREPTKKKSSELKENKAARFPTTTTTSVAAELSTGTTGVAKWHFANALTAPRGVAGVTPERAAASTTRKAGKAWASEKDEKQQQYPEQQWYSANPITPAEGGIFSPSPTIAGFSNDGAGGGGVEPLLGSASYFDYSEELQTTTTTTTTSGHSPFLQWFAQLPSDTADPSAFTAAAPPEGLQQQGRFGTHCSEIPGALLLRHPDVVSSSQSGLGSETPPTFPPPIECPPSLGLASSSLGLMSSMSPFILSTDLNVQPTTSQVAHGRQSEYSVLEPPTTGEGKEEEDVPGPTDPVDWQSSLQEPYDSTIETPTGETLERMLQTFLRQLQDEGIPTDIA